MNDCAIGANKSGLLLFSDVRFWHKADMLNALTNVRLGGKATVANRCLPISIMSTRANVPQPAGGLRLDH